MKICINSKTHGIKKVLIDDEDWPKLKGLSWSLHLHKPSGNFYVSAPLELINNKRKYIRIHRLIMNAKSGEEVDHINHNTLDNRKNNLRVCSRAENSRNQKKQNRRTSSEYKGVCWHKWNKKWVARIRVDGKLIHLSYHKNPIDAAKSYNQAAVFYFGDFALLNKIETSL